MISLNISFLIFETPCSSITNPLGFMHKEFMHKGKKNINEQLKIDSCSFLMACYVQNLFRGKKGIIIALKF